MTIAFLEIRASASDYRCRFFRIFGLFYVIEPFEQKIEWFFEIVATILKKSLAARFWRARFERLALAKGERLNREIIAHTAELTRVAECRKYVR
jgi:hypothetical protein